ncbi:unnamed protein product [Closterium sp. NIES-65]|nr:unnamed protein product [Closterium sp. NIES-65]
MGKGKKLGAEGKGAHAAARRVYGSLPNQEQLSDWEGTIMQHSALPDGVLAVIAALPRDSHPMGVLTGALCALSSFHADANPALQGQDLYKSKAVRNKQIVRVLGKVPTIAAAAYLHMAGRPPVAPAGHLSYAENFLYMLDSMGDRSYRPHPRLARAVDILFILHAEHEMNCSTAAARHLASSGVDVYTALAGATGALYGPLHGGANEAVLKMLSEIGSADKIPEFIQGVKDRKRRMSGFGHRVYKNYDPRAKVIRGLAEEVFSIVGRDPLIEVAVALEQAALSDEYFIKRKLYPNVDFYSGLIYRALGFPTEFFPVLFAIPRMVGYLAHWKESLDDPDTRIMRPQECYIGEWFHHYQPIALRPPSDAEGLGVVCTWHTYICSHPRRSGLKCGVAAVLVTCLLSGLKAQAAGQVDWEAQTESILQQVSQQTYLSSFAEIFTDFYQSGQLYIDQPATLLIPTNVGHWRYQTQWNTLTPKQKRRVLRYHVLKGRYTTQQLLDAPPLTLFPTLNQNLPLNKTVKPNEVYLQSVPAMKFASPLSVPNAGLTDNLAAHGVTFVILPPNLNCTSSACKKRQF